MCPQHGYKFAQRQDTGINITEVLIINLCYKKVKVFSIAPAGLGARKKYSIRTTVLSKELVVHDFSPPPRCIYKRFKRYSKNGCIL